MEYDGVVRVVWESFVWMSEFLWVIYVGDYWHEGREFIFVMKVGDLFWKNFWGVLMLNSWMNFWVYGGLVLQGVIMIILFKSLRGWKDLYLFLLIDGWKSDDSGVCLIYYFPLLMIFSFEFKIIEWEKG